jgi:hypothetical protein
MAGLYTEEAMRSGTNSTITSGQVHTWALGWLLEAKLTKDHGWKCTAAVVLSIVLRAAARCISIPAACRDLAKAPSDHAVMTALEDGLPRTLPVLERRINDALSGPLPRRMRRRAWEIAIDWHLQPYYGEPHKSRNELCHSKAKQGTTTFHAYASACVVEYGRRYTLALTWVRRHESMVRVLGRLVARIREIGLKIRRVLLDRAFFNVSVVEFLQAEDLPFLMPVVIRGRAPKKGKKVTGLRWIKRQGAGWYPPHHEKRKATGGGLDLRRLPQLSEGQEGQTEATEIAVRRVARAWLSDRDSRAVSPALRHRDQLSPDAAGTHLHLHARPSLAAVLPGRGVDAAKYLGMDSSDTPCRRLGQAFLGAGRAQDAEPGPGRYFE